MPDHHHTQRGTLILRILGAGIFIVGALLLARDADWVLLAGLIILSMTAGMFASLTLDLRGCGLTFWFGPGLLRKRMQVAAIQSCSVVRNPWWYGWGIHWTPHGWL